VGFGVVWMISFDFVLGFCIGAGFVWFLWVLSVVMKDYNDIKIGKN